MMMKKYLIGLSVLMSVGAAHAAIEIGLDDFNVGNVSNTVFTISNLEGTPTFDGGALGALGLQANAFLGDIPDASGTLEITLKATDIAGPTVASNWNFGAEAPLYSYGYGLGITSAGESGAFNQHGPGESFQLSFNIDSLSLTPGKALVFSVKDQDGRSFTLFQRTGTSSGVEVATMVGETPGVYSLPVRVTSSFVPNGMLEFAVVDLGWGTLKKLQIDVVDEDPEVIPPTGLKAIPRDAGAILSWNTDATGLLDYYTVYRTNISGDTNTYVSVTNVTETAFTDSGLINDTTYFYAVTITDTNGFESGYSAEVSLIPVALSTDTVLLMHYDASVAASVAVDGGGVVTSWTNQVAPATYVVTPVATYEGVIYPSTNLSASGTAGLDFTDDDKRLQLMGALQSDLLLDTTGGKSGFVVMMALRLDGEGTMQYILSNSGSVNQGFGFRKSANNFQSWLGYRGANLNTTATTGDTVVVSFRYDVADLEFTGWESSSEDTITETRDPIDYSLGLGLLLGGYPTTGNYDFEGELFEVKIWGSTLDDEAMEAERNAMVLKWVGADAGYKSWAALWGGVDIGAMTDDYDNDGLLNIYEYGLDGNPTNDAIEPAVLPGMVNSGSGMEYVHVQRNNDPSLIYSYETTTDLVNGQWTNNGVTSISTNLGTGLFNTVTNGVDLNDNQKFIRLNIGL